ncbi:DUF502 domain-containing protein [Methylotuvimicrobium buryatense]|uniref:DUF502 domain-containing protein n=1 Tax=Methylotuvimicrobium buryatense TaxID=95641 RepID=A0A4V1IKG1_METBY|nr:DUF502 domain-containing protein [Methylotuvimicrobium buryatense]QCW84785.1 DUF502 domain-containing protein [Methylotuvimicrobium buryatense]
MNQQFKAILNNFLIGIFAVIPIVIILQIVIFVKDRVSDLFRMVYGYADNYLYTLMVFAVSFLILSMVGHKIVKEGKFWAIAAFDFIIDRIPLLNSIYRVTKKVINMFSSHDRKEAREVVYIEYPKEGLWVPAYVTNKQDDQYVLFVPTSPNPTSGFTVIVNQSRVIKSEMNIEQATSFIVSVGVDFDKMDEMKKLP